MLSVQSSPAMSSVETTLARVLHVPETPHPPDDLFGMRRIEEVLRPALAEQARRVDHDHLPPSTASLRAAQRHHRRGETRAVEDVGREPDHRLDQILLQ